jgi:membrane-bound ClpP family serine protease
VVIPARHVIQVSLVVGLVAAFTLATNHLGFRSGWNLLWMLGIPFAVARAFDPGDGVWGLAGLWLLLCGLAAMIATAAAFGLGS